MNEQELEEALREIRRILSLPKEEVEKWANDLLDKAKKVREDERMKELMVNLSY